MIHALSWQASMLHLVRAYLEFYLRLRWSLGFEILRSPSTSSLTYSREHDCYFLLFCVGISVNSVLTDLKYVLA